MEDTKQPLLEGRFTDQEVEEILRRAAKLQQEEVGNKERIARADLEAGAEEVGIPRKFIEQAIRELKIKHERKATRRRMFIIVGIAVAILLAVLAILSHRVLNVRLTDVEAKQAQLENVLQRRHDLIPNLIALAKASAAHEKELITSVSTVLQELEKAERFEEKQALEQKLDASVQRLLSAIQADPKASSTVVFVRLSDEMAGAENRIAVERKRYNEAVATYNRAVRSLPIALFRPILGFPKSVTYFQTSEEAKKTPAF